MRKSKSCVRCSLIDHLLSLSVGAGCLWECRFPARSSPSRDVDHSQYVPNATPIITPTQGQRSERCGTGFAAPSEHRLSYCAKAGSRSVRASAARSSTAARATVKAVAHWVGTWSQDGPTSAFWSLHLESRLSLCVPRAVPALSCGKVTLSLTAYVNLNSSSLS